MTPMTLRRSREPNRHSRLTHGERSRPKSKRSGGAFRRWGVRLGGFFDNSGSRKQGSRGSKSGSKASKSRSSASAITSILLSASICESAWNKDPVFGVIGIQSGPPGRWVHSGLRGGYGGQVGDAGGGDDREDPSGVFRPEQTY